MSWQAERWAGSSNGFWCGLRAKRGASEESYLLLTLGIAFAISAGVLYFFGRDARILPGIGGEGSQVFFDAAIRVHAIWLMVISVAVMLVLRLFYNRTLIGLSMMAASIDEEGAATTGINVPRMRSLTFLLGGWSAGWPACWCRRSSPFSTRWGCC